MKKFNKDVQLKKLRNKKNNKPIKIISIVLSVIILIGAIIYFTFARFEYNQTFNLINGTVVESKKTIAETMIKLAENGTTDLAYDGQEYLEELGTEDNNLRYIGKSPNNYVYFNCTTDNVSNMNGGTCEKWRIIGLFNNVEDENGNKSSKIKLIKHQLIGYYSWDSSVDINSSYGINQWGATQDYDGADLMNELNTDYLGNTTIGTDGMWFNEAYNKKVEAMPSSTLNARAQSMIETTLWNLGSPSSNEGIYDADYVNILTPKLAYVRERANTIGKTCGTSETCDDTVTRTATWIGKVGLMYISDYSYASVGGETIDRNGCLSSSSYNWEATNYSDCKSNDWLFNSTNQWTISPYAHPSDAHYAFYITANGRAGGMKTSTSCSVKPVVYLKDNIKIVGGNGSLTYPYKIVMN